MQQLEFAFSGQLGSPRQEVANDLLSLEKIAFAFLVANRFQIEEQISRDIRDYLPPNTFVDAKISFTTGSIVWTGVVTVIAITGAIGGTFEFVEYMQRIISCVVDRALRSQLDQEYIRRVSFDGTRTIARPIAESQAIVTPRAPATRDVPIMLLAGLSIATLIAVVAVIVLQLGWLAQSEGELLKEIKSLGEQIKAVQSKNPG